MKLLSWPRGITLGTWALGVDRPLMGGDTTSKCWGIGGMLSLPDLGGGCGGTFKCWASLDGGKGGGTEVGGKGVVEFDLKLPPE